jgi:hypothetical protein
MGRGSSRTAQEKSLQMDLQVGLDLGESGVMKAPESGLYFFEIHGSGYTEEENVERKWL